jgi:hypothetical protein
MMEYVQYQMVQTKIQHQHTTLDPCNIIKDRNPPSIRGTVDIAQISKSAHHSLKYFLE